MRGRASTISTTWAMTIPWPAWVADHRCFFRVCAKEEVAVAVGLGGRDERHVRLQVGKVTGIEFQVGMDGADMNALFPDEAGKLGRLRSGESEIEP